MTDYYFYNTEMAKALADKLFFLEHCFDFDEFVDFGCADGMLIKTIATKHPDKRFVGYDNCPEMITLASNDCPDNVFFTSKRPLPTTQNSALNLSSVIHEIYSYCTEKEIEDFWTYVFQSGFKYVFIRDMSISHKVKKQSNPQSVAQIRKLASKRHLKEFEAIWGSIDENTNKIHYLLKYRYIKNWEREVKENYLPISTEALLKIIPSNYKITLQKNHQESPFREMWDELVLTYFQNYDIIETWIKNTDVHHLPYQ